MATNIFTIADIHQIATLAALPLSPSEEKKLTQAMTQSMTIVDQILAVNVTNVRPTSQVTGLENIFRDDVVDASRMFSQKEALSNAKRTYNGFFVASAVFE